MAKHPAKFNKEVLKAMEGALASLPPYAIVVDPFAGTGLIHDLPFRTIGIEIAGEWARLHKDTIHGDCLDILPLINGYDAIATSPTYGNRMADQYDGRDGSKRNTYRTALDRELDKNNSGGMQWGPKYRDFHLQAWMVAVNCLQSGGLFVLNMKDHIRGGERQQVTDWHVRTLKNLGLVLLERKRIETPGNRFGANHDLRVEYEEVILFKKP